MAELIYGIRNTDGKAVGIKDVPSGLKCDCVCPNCRGLLVARKGAVKEHHFAHHGEQSRECDIFSANQTALHLMAKEIIAEEQKLFVPAIEIKSGEVKLGQIPPGIRAKLPHTYEYRKAEVLEFREVELEKHLPGFVPDIAASTSENEYFIEIAVTHYIDDEKKEKIEEYGVPTLEIDLAEFAEIPISKEELRQKLIGEIELREWSFHPNYKEARELAQLYYENLPIIKEYQKEQELKRQKECLSLEEQKKKLAEKAKKREIASNKLNNLLQPQNYTTSLKNLRNEHSFRTKAAQTPKSFRFYNDHRQIPFFIDIPITGEMIFKCDRRIWQGIIFNRWIYNRKEEGARINTWDIFEELKDTHKIPIDYDLTYHNLIAGDNVDKTFTFSQDVIRRYMGWMQYIGFVTNGHKWSTVMKRNTIIPPDWRRAKWLQEALSTVDLYSPDIDELLSAEVRKKEAKYEIEEQEKRFRQQEEQRKKEEEAALARTKEGYEQGKKEVQNLDFNQSEIIRDRFGYRWFLCTSCNQIVREGDIVSYKNNENKGQCRECSRKQEREKIAAKRLEQEKSKEIPKVSKCTFLDEWNSCPHLDRSSETCKDNITGCGFNESFQRINNNTKFIK